MFRANFMIVNYLQIIWNKHKCYTFSNCMVSCCPGNENSKAIVVWLTATIRHKF